MLDGLAACHDKGVIDLTGRFGQARPGTLAEHFAPRGIDRDDAPPVAVLAQEAQGTGGVFRRVAGCTDQRDGAGRKERLRESHVENG